MQGNPKRCLEIYISPMCGRIHPKGYIEIYKSISGWIHPKGYIGIYTSHRMDEYVPRDTLRLIQVLMWTGISQGIT